MDDLESFYGEEPSHQQAYEQVQPQGVCWCKNGVDHLRDIIGEEVEKAFKKLLAPYLPSLQSSILPPNSSSLPHLAESSASRKLRLQFKSNIPDKTFFTMTKIDEQCNLFEVELLDEFGTRVEDDLKSVKIKFDVLDGDFNVEDKVNWTQKDYNENIVKPRMNKGELLKGKCKMALSRGAISVGHLCITDNSSHTPSRTFRLGATAQGHSSEVVIEPAVSEAFHVKERRLKSEGKLKEPSPEDALYCLVGIRKTGPIYKRAQEAGVFTVRDFLQRLMANEKELRNILNVPAEGNWNAMVKNAKACKLPVVAIEGCSQQDNENNYTRISDQELIYRPNDFQTGQEHGHLQLPAPVPAPPALQPPSSNDYLDVGASWYSPHADQGPMHGSFTPEFSGQYDLSQWMQLLRDSPQLDEWGSVSQHSTKGPITSKLRAVCYVTKAAELFMFSIQRDSGTGAPQKRQRLH